MVVRDLETYTGFSGPVSSMIFVLMQFVLWSQLLFFAATKNISLMVRDVNSTCTMPTIFLTSEQKIVLKLFASNSLIYQTALINGLTDFRI